MPPIASLRNEFVARGSRQWHGKYARLACPTNPCKKKTTGAREQTTCGALPRGFKLTDYMPWLPKLTHVMPDGPRLSSDMRMCSKLANDVPGKWKLTRDMSRGVKTDKWHAQRLEANM